MSIEVHVQKVNIDDCTEARCATCHVPEHTRILCRAVTQWKRAVGAMRGPTPDPKIAEAVLLEIESAVACCITFAVEAGLLVCDNDYLRFLRWMTQIANGVADVVAPEARKQMTATLLARLMDRHADDAGEPVKFH